MLCNKQYYCLKAILECVLWLGFLQKITLQSSMRSNHHYVASIFFKFSENSFLIEYFVYKRVFGFPPSCFYYVFMRLFLFQSKTRNAVKDINQNFTSNELDEKQSKHPFVKKRICEHLTF